ncbi:MAG: UbiA family prenyltransferase, partial [Paracoccaceae bacterium]
LAFFILITYNKAAIIVGLCSLIPVVVYPFAKRFTWWPQVFLGIAFNWGILFAWTAHNGSIESPAILLYLAGIFWTLFYDTIYAHQDIEDDLLIGIKSTAIFFGESTKKWLGVFIILICFFFITAIIGTFEIAYQHKQMIICTIGIIIFGFHLIWQAIKVDIKNWASCLHVFRSNRDAGLIIVLFLAIAGIF